MAPSHSASSESSGQLQTKAPLDHEAKGSYTVTVTATDGSGASATIGVTITVTDANDPPAFGRLRRLPAPSPKTRRRAKTSAPRSQATDPENGDTLTYTLGGTDAASFDIVETSGQLQTKAALDYETKSSYTVTVTASDGALTAEVAVTIEVTNADDEGTVTLSTNQPSARTEITATLADLDDGVTGKTWQWARSTDRNSWSDISSATQATYTTVDGDVGYYLRATAVLFRWAWSEQERTGGIGQCGPGRGKPSAGVRRGYRHPRGP